MPIQFQPSLHINRPLAAPLSSLLSVVPLTPSVRTHVAQVYSVLAIMMFVTCSTIYLDVGPRLVPWLSSSTWIPILSLVAVLAGFQLVPRTKEQLGLRKSLLFAFATLKGIYFAPFIETLGFVSPRIVPQAAICSFLLFTSFSLAAMYARRRSVMYTMGALGALATVSLLVSLSRWLFGVQYSLTAQLLIGLMMASIYVILDTQIMIHRSMAANLLDPVSREHLCLDHAVELYVDLVQVFVHIAVALADRESRRNEDGRGERGGGGSDANRGRGKTRQR